MPELPEAETIKRDLKKVILGQRIVQVAVNNAKVIRAPAPKIFAKDIAGAVIKDVFRKGKAIILELSCSKDLVVQLGMTGQLIYPGNAKASRVSFRLSNGKLLDYNDQRMFGGLSLLSRHEELEYIKNLGPEPFGLKTGEFNALLSGKKTKIKVLLMDQQFISGVGNIYANEALFRAGIRPERQANNLTAAETGKLLAEINNCLKEAIKCGGSSVDNYVRLSGEKGGYVPHLKIYGRDGKPCFKCNTAIKKITLAGRGTFFCPKCQPR